MKKYDKLFEFLQAALTETSPEVRGRQMNTKPDYDAFIFRCEESIKLLKMLFYERGHEK